MLEEVLKKDYIELVPSQMFKGDISVLNNDDFEKLRKHMNISDYSMSENEYNVIKIGNLLFIKQY